MTDLVREIEDILCDFATFTDNSATIAAFATLVQRKLDEATITKAVEVLASDEVRAWRADSELLAKVGWLLPRRGQIEIRLDEDGDWYARSALIEHPASVRHGGGAPTLVEALRKLVGEEP